MKTHHILFNPFAGTQADRNGIAALDSLYERTVRHDITQITDYATFFSTLNQEDSIVLCGGDGTVSRFANNIQGLNIPNSIYYYACGTGNDFARDLGKKKGEDPYYRINPYLNALPTVEVGSTTRLFLNGVGYGIDGYCCEVGDALKKEGKPVNYTNIAIEGLLFHYKPTSAIVTVDGVPHTYTDVWLAPTMNGRYYGGGMMPTPNQNRLADGNPLSIMIMHSPSKLKTLCLFPSLFKGEHIRRKDMVEILTGHTITVDFYRPTPLQIDGETIRSVTRYCARSHAAV